MQGFTAKKSSLWSHFDTKTKSYKDNMLVERETCLLKETVEEDQKKRKKRNENNQSKREKPITL